MPGYLEERVLDTAKRVEMLEYWGKLTFAAAAVCAVCLIVMTAALGYVAYEYARLKRAVSDSATEMSTRFDERAKTLRTPVVSPSRTKSF